MSRQDTNTTGDISDKVINCCYKKKSIHIFGSISESCFYIYAADIKISKLNMAINLIPTAIHRIKYTLNFKYSTPPTCTVNGWHC